MICEHSLTLMIPTIKLSMPAKSGTCSRRSNVVAGRIARSDVRGHGVGDAQFEPEAGVRYSLTNPRAYADSNLIGFMNILDICRHAKVEHPVYVSSSSVYGSNTKIPFAETDSVDQPPCGYQKSQRTDGARL